MKLDDSLTEQQRELLTAPFAQRKWLTLQKQFKALYYRGTAPTSPTSFPFYRQMHKLFTNYASAQLDLKNNSTMNQTTDADVTAYVMSFILDDGAHYDDEDMKQSYSNDSNNVKPSLSKATIIRQSLAELPKEAISIHATKMKIEPNTPFNARYQLSTILNFRNAQRTSLKRRNISDQLELFVKKKSEPEVPEELTILETTDDDSFEGEVEALSECDFSDVLHVKLKSKTFGSSGSSSDVVIMEQDCSVLEIPSLGESTVDALRAAQPTPVSRKAVVKASRQLNWSEDISEVPLWASNTSEDPPAWFLRFLSKYDKDVKLIHSRMDAIDVKLTKIIAGKDVQFGL